MNVEGKSSRNHCDLKNQITFVIFTCEPNYFDKSIALRTSSSTPIIIKRSCKVQKDDTYGLCLDRPTWCPFRLRCDPCGSSHFGPHLHLILFISGLGSFHS